MSNLDDLFNIYKTEYYEDLPHSRNKLSKHFGTSGMDNSRVRRAARNSNGRRHR